MYEHVMMMLGVSGFAISVFSVWWQWDGRRTKIAIINKEYSIRTHVENLKEIKHNRSYDEMATVNGLYTYSLDIKLLNDSTHPITILDMKLSSFGRSFGEMSAMQDLRICKTESFPIVIPEHSLYEKRICFGTTAFVAKEEGSPTEAELLIITHKKTFRFPIVMILQET